MRHVHPAGLILALCLAVSEGLAQEIRAVALDRETKKPVADVRVSLLSRKREELDTARSAQDGSFVLRASEAGKFFISVQRQGQAAEESDAIFLEKGETRSDTLYVTPSRLLQKIDVVIGREIFRILGVTISSMAPRQLILPEEIAEVRKGARTAADIVMQTGPSYLRVLGLGTGRICYQLARDECARVYLNGQPMQTNTDVPAEELEAAAVITAQSVQATLGRNSGIVMLWTRGMLKTAR
jgi:hypothetical protein